MLFTLRNRKTQMKQLGRTQEEVLASLKRHGTWTDTLGSPRWVWKNNSTTKRVLDSLVQRNLVTAQDGTYRPVDQD
jgi:hypothetical protein